MELQLTLFCIFLIQLIRSQFKLPMLSVRPDCVGVMRDLFIDEQHEVPREHSPSPYFMDNANPQKYFKSSEPLLFGHNLEFVSE